MIFQCILLAGLRQWPRKTKQIGADHYHALPLGVLDGQRS